MNMQELQDFFSDKPAEVSIDFVKGTKTDCVLNVNISLDNEQFLQMGYELPFEQADGFIKELQGELDSLKELAK